MFKYVLLAASILAPHLAFGAGASFPPVTVDGTTISNSSGVLSATGVLPSAVVGSPTGGNEGAGSINAQSIYLNGSLLTTTTATCSSGTNCVFGGTTSLTAIQGPSTGNFVITAGAAGQQILIKNSSAAIMLNINSSANQIQPGSPIAYYPTTALSGSWSAGAAGAASYYSTTYTGTIAPTAGFYPEFENITFNEASGSTANQNQNGIHSSTATLGSNVTGNLYTYDIGAKVTSTVTTTTLEAHSLRATSLATASLGGTSGAFTGTLIGAAIKVNLNTGALYYLQNMALEVVNQTQSGSSVNYNYSVRDMTSIAVRGVLDDAGFVTDATSGIGHKYGFEYGSAIGGPGFGTNTDCTIFFGQGLAGAAFTVANGVDWHLATFTGYAWNDGHLTIDGSGDLSTSGTITLSSLPTGTAATYACFTSAGKIVSSATAC